MKVTINDKEYSIYWKHLRLVEENEENGTTKLIPTGGTTLCRITQLKENEADEDIYFEGFAFCSEKDVYCKSIGRKHSLTRALFAMQLPKDIRRNIWNNYLNQPTGQGS